METNNKETNNKDKTKITRKAKKAGLGILVLTALIGASAVVVALVNNSASAGESGERTEAPGHHRNGGDRDGADHADEAGEAVSAEEAAERRDDGDSKWKGSPRAYKLAVYLLNESDNEVATCLRNSAGDILGVNTSSQTLSVRLTNFLSTERSGERTVVVSDGSRSVEVTEALYNQLVTAARECISDISAEERAEMKDLVDLRPTRRSADGDEVSYMAGVLRRFFFGEGVEAGLRQCVTDLVEDTLGLNASSPDLANVIEIVRNDATISVSDGSRTVELTPALMDEVIDGVKDCLGPAFEDFKNRLDGDFENHENDYDTSDSSGQEA